MTGPPPRFAAIPVAVIAGIVAVVHLVLATVPRSWLDEDLMLAIGRHHLDLGAVDQPPLTRKGTTRTLGRTRRMQQLGPEQVHRKLSKPNRPNGHERTAEHGLLCNATPAVQA